MARRPAQGKPGGIGAPFQLLHHGQDPSGRGRGRGPGVVRGECVHVERTPAEETEPLDGIDIGRVVDQGEIGALDWWCFDLGQHQPALGDPAEHGTQSLGPLRVVSAGVVQGSHRAGGHHHFHAVLSHRCPIGCISMGSGPAR